jgi:hypothetical protein
LTDTPANSNSRPKLRALDVRPYAHEGQAYYMLRDPMQLSDHVLLVPQALGPLLAMMDGSWDAVQLESILALRHNVRLEVGLLGSLIKSLDDAYMLDNERLSSARARQVEAYRAAPHRPAALAGVSYPDDPDELRAYLDAYLETEAADVLPGAGRGLLSPHIDFERGGAAYARIWKRAQRVANEAELVVILGTDHYSDEPGSLTPTRQSYATPYGVLPTDVAAVDAIAAAIDAAALNGQRAFDGELRHRGEHALELVLVWLHHMRGGRPVPVIPILTGSFSGYLQGNDAPICDPRLAALVAAIRSACAGRNTLFVSSGDLSHVGPAFEGQPLDDQAKALLRVDDAEIIDRLCEGDDEGFYLALKKTQNGSNVCGLSPTYLILKLLGMTDGEQVSYQVCPADAQATSVVSITGILFE